MVPRSREDEVKANADYMATEPGEIWMANIIVDIEWYQLQLQNPTATSPRRGAVTMD